jgi:ribosomal protein L11 methyltransferase
MTSSSSFVLKIAIPRQVRVEGRALSREDFYSWLWQVFGQQNGLQGVHEGTLLSEQAAEAGFETESWTLDAAEAPRERDWMASQAMSEAELFFASLPQAEEAMRRLAEFTEFLGLGKDAIREQKAEDWDAQWKASFLGNTKGVKVPPFWRILPPWVTVEEAQLDPGEVILRINPGAGFGTGTHETTQLCLEAIGERARGGGGLAGAKVLDFGSGSGILSIGAALAGGHVLGVEIDELAIDNALENARLNGVETSVRYSRTLDDANDIYPVVIANILKPVLIEHAPALVRRLDPKHGLLILSGLIEKDVAGVDERYSELLGGRKPRKRELGEWRALVWAL